jgi:hypothetical protein
MNPIETKFLNLPILDHNSEIPTITRSQGTGTLTNAQISELIFIGKIE